MMRRILALALCAAAVPAAALPIGGQAGAEAGDAASAVTMRHRLRADPDCAMTMANLARHYVRTGRPERAERLYRGLLALDDVSLERTGGAAVSSHWLAAEAMRGLARPQLVRLSARP